ncbi:MAG TPA: UbiA family prenyltransferase [Motilibacteraceae bacterium]|nr:UbiA family prenyltransferase [Motilibacteraceae bacterium]
MTTPGRPPVLPPGSTPGTPQGAAPTGAGLPRTVLALAGSCHPGPTLAVTGLSGLLAALAGVPAGRLVVLVAAVLTGQLGIGWANDALDAERDRSHGRADKPVATGGVSPGTTWRAALAAAAACVPLSLATGLLPGLVHLVAVAGGWVYDLGAKRAPVSALPYALSFGLLPVFVLLAAGPAPAPGALWWLPLAGALLGVGAHLLNGLPDIADDAAAGLRPLPVVLGPARALGLGAALLVAAALVLALAPATVPTPVRWLAPAAALAAAVGAVALGRRSGRRTRAPFALAVLAAGVDVALLGLVLHG